MASQTQRVIDSLTLGAAIAALAVAVAAALRSEGDVTRAPADRSVDNWEALAGSGHTRGSADAPVTIIEFGDYQCPACRTVQQAIDGVLAEYADSILFVYRHWPLPYHGDALAAASASECAAQEGLFWEYHRGLYASTDLSEETLLRLARDVGVGDPDSFKECLSAPSPTAAIERDLEAARDLQAIGTPALIVNGVLLGNVPDRVALAERVVTHFRR